jgi:hypothetical protein
MEDQERKQLIDKLAGFLSEQKDQAGQIFAERTAELSSLVTGPNSGAKGFLDVSFRGELPRDQVIVPAIDFWAEMDEEHRTFAAVARSTQRDDFFAWGEVRIEPTSPELLLQQVEFYASNLKRNDLIWVLADFDLSDFKRMASPQFPQLKCFRLGQQFEEWCANRARPEVPEL